MTVPSSIPPAMSPMGYWSAADFKTAPDQEMLEKRLLVLTEPRGRGPTAFEGELSTTEEEEEEGRRFKSYSSRSPP